MTVKVNYFNFVYLILFAFLLACNVGKKELIYETSFQSITCNSSHIRALTVNNDLVALGSKSGYFTSFNLDSIQPIANSIDNVEDFRDIEILSDKTILMNSGNHGTIYSVYQNQHQIVFDSSSVFLDGLSFWNEQVGIVYGDPIHDKFFIAKTFNGGEEWISYTPQTFPMVLKNEAAFAASGTGIQTIGDSTVFFGTGGGAIARLFISIDQGNNWVAKNTPMKSGESYGIYSIFFWGENEGVIIGGSYVDSTYNEGICQYTTDKGDTWIDRSNGLLGYCSCVNGTANGELLVATGRVGTFYSLNKGRNWLKLTETPYYSCALTNSQIILVGKNGRLEIIDYSIK